MPVQIRGAVSPDVAAAIGVAVHQHFSTVVVTPEVAAAIGAALHCHFAAAGASAAASSVPEGLTPWALAGRIRLMEQRFRVLHRNTAAVERLR